MSVTFADGTKTREEPEDPIGEWIERVNNEGRNLTAWELDFMISITDQYEHTGSLSPKQRKQLERIYSEKTP